MLRDGTSGFIRFSVGGYGRTAYITPLGINDWRLVTIVPDAVTEDICDPINRGALSFSIKLFLAFVMSAMLISFIIFRTRREVEGVNQERDSMADISPGGIVKCTRDDFRMLYINQGCLELAGYSREELEDRFQNVFLGVVYPEDRDRLTALMRECGSEPLQCEYRIVTISEIPERVIAPPIERVTAASKKDAASGLNFTIIFPWLAPSGKLIIGAPCPVSGFTASIS